MKKTVAEVFGLKQPAAFKSGLPFAKVINDKLLVGVELEIENLREGQAAYITKAGKGWTVVEDGSLRPRGEAWEFVSKPMYLGNLVSEMDTLFTKLRVTDANYTDRCSVHVHTNVLDFTQEELANLTLVYPVFEEVLFQFVNHFDKKEEQGYCRDTNLYCIPWTACRLNRNFISKFFDDPSIYRNNPDLIAMGRPSWEKYTALNLQPIGRQGTVEWRHMHGTADMKKLTIWLNLIGAIMEFCKKTAFEDNVKAVKSLNDVSTYQQFFQAVLQDVLPYKEDYRLSMAEGVVNAKLSLINWERDKDKPKKAKTERPRADLAGAQIQWGDNMMDFTTPAPNPEEFQGLQREWNDALQAFQQEELRRLQERALARQRRPATQADGAADAAGDAPREWIRVQAVRPEVRDIPQPAPAPRRR